MSMAELPGHKDRDTPEPDAERIHEIAQRRERVALMLVARLPQRQIAKQLHVGLGTVCRDIEAIRADWKAGAGQAYTEHVVEEKARLDAMEGPFMAKALNGDIAAGNLVVRISESRRKLMGLDAPQRIEHGFGTIQDLESYRARVYEMIDAAFEDDDDVIDV